MPSIRLQNMGGIAPRVSPRLLPLSAAQIAEGVKLWSGEIRSFRTGLLKPDPMPSAPVETIFHIAGAWLAWKTDVDVVIGFTADEALGRVYYTGDGNPKVIQQVVAASEAPTPTSAYPLGVVPPANAPIITTTAPGSPQEFRTYVYTWLTTFGEESVPSFPSDAILVQDGINAEVNFSSSLPPTNVNRVRIYRSNGGPYIFVAEVPQFTGIYNDVLTNDEIEGNEQLISQQWYPPDPSMIGLIGTANGFLAGFFGNKVAFSEPYQPHAWPPAYVKVFDYDIVALATYGTTVVVLTKGPTYLVDGIDPRNLSVSRVPDAYPCVSKRSVSVGDRGVYYSCDAGLAFVGSGGVQIVTKDLMDEDDWAAWKPSTMHGTVFDGYYFGFFRGERQTSDPNPNGMGFILDINDRATASYDKCLLTTIPFYATAVFASPDVRLHYVTARLTVAELFEWDRGPDLLTYLWRSKLIVFPYNVSFGAAKVVCACDAQRNVTVRLLDGTCNQVVFERIVTSGNPFRLPALRSRLNWVVEVEGTGDVQEIHFATSITELTEGDA
jgi:hypothetical protein